MTVAHYKDPNTTAHFETPVTQLFTRKLSNMSETKVVFRVTMNCELLGRSNLDTLNKNFKPNLGMDLTCGHFLITPQLFVFHSSQQTVKTPSFSK